MSVNGKHNRRDYKDLNARENTHHAALVVHFGPSGAIERFLRFSTCLERKGGQNLLSSHQMPNLSKILTVRETYGIRRTAGVHEEAVQLTWKSNSYELTWRCAKQSFS